MCMCAPTLSMFVIIDVQYAGMCYERAECVIFFLNCNVCILGMSLAADYYGVPTVCLATVFVIGRTTCPSRIWFHIEEMTTRVSHPRTARVTRTERVGRNFIPFGWPWQWFSCYTVVVIVFNVLLLVIMRFSGLLFLWPVLVVLTGEFVVILFNAEPRLVPPPVTRNKEYGFILKACTLLVYYQFRVDVTVSLWSVWIVRSNDIDKSWVWVGW